MIIQPSMFSESGRGLFQVWIPNKNKESICSKCNKVITGVHFHPQRMTKAIYDFKMSQNVAVKNRI